MAQFLKILQALKYVKQFIDWLNAYVLKKKGEANVSKVDAAAKAIDEANKLKDESARIAAKQKAMKEMQDALNGK